MLPSSDGTPPALPLHLWGLDWRLNEVNLSFILNFLSPHLTTVIITVGTRRAFPPVAGKTVWPKMPDDVVPVMCSAIKLFPPSPQIVRIRLGFGLETRLTNEFSTFVLGCREALQELATNVVLSIQAIVHLMKLPNLYAWTTEQGPPQVVDLIRHGVPDGPVSLFPSLESLDLRGETAFRWLSLFKANKSCSPPWIMVGGVLLNVTCNNTAIPIDSSLVSRFLPFTGLVELRIRTDCLFRPCVSKFTDEDVERLAIALPKLEAISLGKRPCLSDTCPTTIRSLLSFSIHCLKLRYLNIHFRAANLWANMVDVFCHAYSQGLHLRPKSSLQTLVTQETPISINLSGHSAAFISIGMLMIFPSLTKFVLGCPAWTQLEVLVKDFGLRQELPVLTEKLMKLLSEARVQATENQGVPASPFVSPRLFF